jgi:hypothetical protein
MYDPDAPTGSGWWHWLVFDIPTNVNELVSGAGNTKLNLTPEGVIQSITDYGAAGYGGPCPPEGHGLHQYIITVHDSNTKLPNFVFEVELELWAELFFVCFGTVHLFIYLFFIVIFVILFLFIFLLLFFVFLFLGCAPVCTMLCQSPSHKLEVRLNS